MSLSPGQGTGTGSRPACNHRGRPVASSALEKTLMVDEAHTSKCS